MNTEQHRLWREQENAHIAALQTKLSIKHSVPRNAKFDKAWRLAWEYGHSSSFEEVESYFDELVELIKE